MQVHRECTRTGPYYMTNIIELKSKRDFLEAIEGDRVVVDFAMRNGCVPCKRLEPHLASAASSDAMKDISFYKVLIDEVDADLLTYTMETVGIMSTPTLLEYRAGSLHDDIAARTAPLLIKELS